MRATSVTSLDAVQQPDGGLGEGAISDRGAARRGGGLTLVRMGEPPAQTVNGLAGGGELQVVGEQVVAFGAGVAQERHAARGHLGLARSDRPACGVVPALVLAPVQVESDLA